MELQSNHRLYRRANDPASMEGRSWHAQRLGSSVRGSEGRRSVCSSSMLRALGCDCAACRALERGWSWHRALHNVVRGWRATRQPLHSSACHRHLRHRGHLADAATCFAFARVPTHDSWALRLQDPSLLSRRCVMSPGDRVTSKTGTRPFRSLLITTQFADGTTCSTRSREQTMAGRGQDSQ